MVLAVVHLVEEREPHRVLRVREVDAHVRGQAVVVEDLPDAAQVLTLPTPLEAGLHVAVFEQVRGRSGHDALRIVPGVVQVDAVAEAAAHPLVEVVGGIVDLLLGVAEGVAALAPAVAVPVSRPLSRILCDLSQAAQVQVNTRDHHGPRLVTGLAPGAFETFLHRVPVQVVGHALQAGVQAVLLALEIEAAEVVGRHGPPLPTPPGRIERLDRDGVEPERERAGFRQFDRL